jgi:hypothetical protein
VILCLGIEVVKLINLELQCRTASFHTSHVNHVNYFALLMKTSYQELIKVTIVTFDSP